MIVQDMDKLVGFTLDFIQEKQIVEETVVQDLARRAEECKSAAEINGWLKVVKGNITEPQYQELKRRFEELNSENLSKKRKDGKVDTENVKNAEARFALDFVQEAQLLTEEVISLLVNHANSITGGNTAKEHARWMTFVKDKIGPSKFKEMQKEYVEFRKRDCGFESTTPDEMTELFKKYRSFAQG